MTVLVLQIDRDLARHLALAASEWKWKLIRSKLAVPPELVEFEDAMRARARLLEGHEGSGRPLASSGADDHISDREYLSSQDVARLAGVSVSTVKRWTSSGELASHKHGRLRRIRRSDLDAFLDA